MQIPQDSPRRGKKVVSSRGFGSETADASGKAFPTVKAVGILEAIASARRPLGVSEIGVLLGLPKPTAHRIVRMLESEGLLQHEPGTRRFVPGARLVKFGLDIVGAAMLSAPRHSILEALSQNVGETCNFGVMNGRHVVYLDRVESEWPLGLRFEPGSRVPMYCTAMGKLFLSWLPKARRAALLGSMPLHRYTENTIVDPENLEKELEKIRSSKISIDNQEFLAGVICVAVPVFDSSGEPVAAIAISAPLARMSVENGLSHVPLLRVSASRLTETFDQEEIK
ncbi:MAG: IclR family transcriptional regulator [Bradyrhizobiaceae bacterium]|nr:MAG: IclR family transcriptional regulator [Bradyrhizobiaceae bacterium]